MHCSKYVVGLMLLSSAAAASEASHCVSIADDMRRLRCYDLANGRSIAQLETAQPSAQTSDWERRILEDGALRTFSLTTYQPNYAPLTHLRSINRAPYQLLDPQQRLDHEEVKFQVSARSKLADDLLFGNGDLWFRYSQTAYWQALSPRLSSPVREMTYEPDLHISFLTELTLLGLTVRNVDLGVVHQSNGRSGPLSRSWNRAYADIDVLAGAWSFNLRSWARLRSSLDEDNPDILDYLGHYEVRTSWRRDDHMLNLILRNVFFDDHYGAELTWTFPLVGRLRGMVQWFSGYGENLIDYDHANRRIGVGIVFADRP